MARDLGHRSGEMGSRRPSALRQQRTKSLKKTIGPSFQVDEEANVKSSIETSDRQKHRRLQTWGASPLGALDGLSYQLELGETTCEKEQARQQRRISSTNVANRIRALNHARGVSTANLTAQMNKGNGVGVDCGRLSPKHHMDHVVERGRRSPQQDNGTLDDHRWNTKHGFGVGGGTAFIAPALLFDNSQGETVKTNSSPVANPNERKDDSLAPEKFRSGEDGKTRNEKGVDHSFLPEQVLPYVHKVPKHAEKDEQESSKRFVVDMHDDIRTNNCIEFGKVGHPTENATEGEMFPLKGSNGEKDQKNSSGIVKSQSLTSLFKMLFIPFAHSNSNAPTGRSGASSSYGSMSSGIGTKASGKRKRPSTLHSLHQSMKEKLHPIILVKREFLFLRTTFAYVILPGLIAATVLYYCMGNPKITFLTLDVSASWLLIFLVRQCLTLHFAWNAEYVFVQVLALRSTLYRTIFGPLIPLFVIQAIGWPFVVACWGLLDLMLLADSHPFQRNWLYFLGIKMFSGDNYDGGILGSRFYLRLMTSLIIVGVATSIKRTYVALLIGRRTFVRYKPQLESVMADIRILIEVANLGAETELIDFDKLIAVAEQFVPKQRVRSTSFVVQFQDGKQSLEDCLSCSESSNSSVSDVESISEKNGSVTSDDTDDDTSSSEASNGTDLEKSYRHRQVTPTPSDFGIGANMYESNHVHKNNIEESLGTHSFSHMKNMLDSWEQPVNKAHKISSPSIHDILKFRTALLYMEDTYPFSISFGRADSRDHCLRSATRLYKRLLKYTPGRTNLEYDVIRALAYEGDGHLNEKKLKHLVRLFRPSGTDDLSLLAFVQSCDRIFKNLRFFLASVGNSVTIDRVLEQIVNAIFFLLLFLLILHVLCLDPWRLIMSLSTIVVSFAFAFGPSTAKYIDGILLIAVRRPFDLGDRISFASADGANPGMGETWIVEDITLSSTTLRFAGTNEVSTINNASIANSRIFNGSRSPKAIVTIVVTLKVDATHKQVQEFRDAIEKFLVDNSSSWTSIVHFRTELIDNDAGFVQYSLRVQHRKPWQEQSAVLNDKGELTTICNQVAHKLNISFVSSATCVDLRMRDADISGNTCSSGKMARELFAQHSFQGFKMTPE